MFLTQCSATFSYSRHTKTMSKFLRHTSAKKRRKLTHQITVTAVQWDQQFNGMLGFVVTSSSLHVGLYIWNGNSKFPINFFQAWSFVIFDQHQRRKTLFTQICGAELEKNFESFFRNLPIFFSNSDPKFIQSNITEFQSQCSVISQFKKVFFNRQW